MHRFKTSCLLLLVLYGVPGLYADPRPQYADGVVPQSEEHNAQVIEIDDVFEYHGTAMLLIEPDTGRIRNANRAARDFYGYPDLVGKNIDRINQLSPEEVAAEMELARRDEQNYFSFRHLLADGSVRDVQVYSYPVTIDDAELLFSIVLDQTERIRAERALEQRNRMIILGLLAVAVLVGAFSVYLWRAARRHATDERTIRELLEEKELLLREVHHRIKNNMQTVSGLLQLQAGNIEDSAAANALSAAKARVHSMMVLYDELYRSEITGGGSVRDYLSSLAGDIVRNADRAGQAELHTDIDDARLDARTLSAIGIIVNELVANAFKHAFIDGRPGRIEVTFRSPHPTKQTGVLADETCHLLQVSDNGTGISDSFDPQTSGGFGWTVVTAMTDQLKGELLIEREQGTRVSIRFQCNAPGEPVQSAD